jgi:hypothetical protein
MLDIQVAFATLDAGGFSIFVVFFGHIVGWNFPGLYFALIGIERIFHAADGRGLTGLTFFDQLFHTLRVRNSPSGESLQVA